MTDRVDGRQEPPSPEPDRPSEAGRRLSAGAPDQSRRRLAPALDLRLALPSSGPRRPWPRAIGQASPGLCRRRQARTRSAGRHRWLTVRTASVGLSFFFTLCAELLATARRAGLRARPGGRRGRSSSRQVLEPGDPDQASSTSSRPCGMPRIRARASARICRAARIVSSGPAIDDSLEPGLLPRGDGEQDRLRPDRRAPSRRGGSRARRPAGRSAARPRRRPGRAAQSTAAGSWSARASSRSSSRSSLAVPSSAWTTSTVSFGLPEERSCSSSDWASRIEPARPAGDDLKRLGLGLDLLAVADLREGLDDRLGRDPGEVVPLAAREDGDRDLVRLGRREEELDVRRRLFQRLQQGVEGPGREHVDFVDVVDLEPGPAGPERRRSAAARGPARRRCCWPRRSR